MEREALSAIPAHNPHGIIRFIFIAMVAACAAIVMATLIAYRFSRERREWDVRTCRLVTATVLGKGQSIREQGGVSLTAYHVRYSVSFGGRRLEALATVARDHYAWLRVGDSTPAYIDSANPDRHFLKLERDNRIGRHVKPAYAAGAVGLTLICLRILADRRWPGR